MLRNYLGYLDTEIRNLIRTNQIANVFPYLAGNCLAYSNIIYQLSNRGHWRHSGRWSTQIDLNSLPINGDLEGFANEGWGIDNTIEKAECLATLAIRLIDYNDTQGIAILEDALRAAQNASPYIFENVIDPSLPSRAIANVAIMMSEVELSRSISEAQSIPLAFWRAWTFTKIAARHTAHEISLVNELLENALRTAEWVQPDYDRFRCLRDIATVAARTNVSMAIDIARSIRAYSSRAEALASIAESIASTDSDYALSIFQEALDVAQGIRQATQSFDAQVNALTFIGACLARADVLDAKQVFTEAYSIALNLPESPDNLRSLAMTGLVETMGEYIPDWAEIIARMIPDSDYRVKARSTLIALVAKTDANRALSLLDGIDENVELARILPVVIGSLFDQSHEFAMAAFAATRFYTPSTVFETVRCMDQFLSQLGGKALIGKVYECLRIVELSGLKGLLTQASTDSAPVASR